MVSVIIKAHDSQSKPASWSLFCAPYTLVVPHTPSLPFLFTPTAMYAYVMPCFSTLQSWVLSQKPAPTPQYFLSFLDLGPVAVGLKGRCFTKHLAYLTKLQVPSPRDSIRLVQGNLEIFIFNKSDDPKLVVSSVYTENPDLDTHIACGGRTLYCLQGFSSKAWWLHWIVSMALLFLSFSLLSPKTSTQTYTVIMTGKERRNCKKYKLGDSGLALRGNWGFYPPLLHSSGKAATYIQTLVHILLSCFMKIILAYPS